MVLAGNACVACNVNVKGTVAFHNTASSFESYIVGKDKGDLVLDIGGSGTVIATLAVGGNQKRESANNVCGRNNAVAGYYVAKGFSASVSNTKTNVGGMDNGIVSYLVVNGCATGEPCKTKVCRDNAKTIARHYVVAGGCSANALGCGGRAPNTSVRDNMVQGYLVTRG